jgi:predicted CXXCH cytochrome family protein
MKAKTQRNIAYCITVVLFVVGVVCYAGFSQKTPANPVRIMYQTKAGKVLFDHKRHASANGYGIDCSDCHHNLEDEEGSKPVACNTCHKPDNDDEAPKLSEAFHTLCIDCHKDQDAGPVKCSECHVH